MAITQNTSTKQDILQYLLQQGQATALDLAKNLDISPQAIRRHLKDLSTDSLVEHQVVQTKIGRPQYVYQLSRQGRDRFPHRYGEFAVSFLDTLTETLGEEKVSEVLQKQWERKALDYKQHLGEGSLQQRLLKLVELRKQEGYMAEVQPVKSSSETYILAEHNCAIAEVAESYPKVCDHELELFSSILPECKVERTHWMNKGEHRCGYLIEAKLNVNL